MSHEDAKKACGSSWPSTKSTNNDLGLISAKCCPVTNGFIVVEDPAQPGETICQPCSFGGKLKPDGTNCLLCSNKGGEIEDFCYDDPILAFVSHNLDCFRPVDEYTAKECKKNEGVSPMKFETYWNTYAGLEFIFSLPKFEKKIVELLSKIEEDQGLRTLINFEFKDTNNEDIPEDQFEVKITILNKELPSNHKI